MAAPPHLHLQLNFPLALPNPPDTPRLSPALAQHGPGFSLENEPVWQSRSSSKVTSSQPNSYFWIKPQLEPAPYKSSSPGPKIGGEKKAQFGVFWSITAQIPPWLRCA